MSRILSTQQNNWLDVATAVIRNGGVVALAFERLFGLAADALNPDAVAKVARIKSRAEHSVGSRPIAVILPSANSVSLFCESFGHEASRLAARHWPGPLTLVVRAKSDLPSPLVSESGLIGLRVAGESPAAKLAQIVNLPLTATSANHAGAKDALSHHDVIGLEEIDLIIEGHVPGPPGSTVVDASGESLKVLRQGIIRIAEG